MPISAQMDDGAVMYVRIPAFSEFPIISVVHPAYHALPNGGQPSFCPSGNRRLSWERVFATDHSRQKNNQLRISAVGRRRVGETDEGL